MSSFFLIPISLQEILNLHDKYTTSESLEKNIGDGYLLKRNPIFRNIRAAYQKLGFGFCYEGAVKEIYSVCPLASLNLIMEEKIIPYFNNVDAMRRFLGMQPNYQINLFETSYWKTNVLLHESSHCIADKVLEEINFAKDICENYAHQKEAICSILGEAFANTIDNLLFTEVENFIDVYFCLSNSYMRFNTAEQKRYNSLKKKLGFYHFFRLFFMSYFYSNYLFNKTEVNPKTALSIAKFILEKSCIDLNLIEQTADDIIYIVKAAFKLNPLFRTQTTAKYFKLIGYENVLKDLFSFDIHDFLHTHSIKINLLCEQLFAVVEPHFSSSCKTNLCAFSTSENHF